MKNGYCRGISANIILLGIVSFLNDVSSEMIMPVLPMFITALGGAGLAVGLIGGLRDCISSILQVLCGYWSDRTGKRKIFVWSGYLVSAVFKLSLAFCRTYPLAILLAGLERMGKGLRTAARDAIIADSMPAQRGKGFGVHRALDSSGAILGSILAFLLLSLLNVGYRPVIFIAGVIGLASLIAMRFVKDAGAQRHNISLKVGLRALPKPLRLFIVVSGVFALGNFSYMFFIIRAQQSFSGKLSVAVPILLYALFNIVYAILAVPFGHLSDRIGRGKVIILGYLLFALTSFGFAAFTSLPAFVLLFALYGATYAAIDGTQRAFVADLSCRTLEATALGTFHTTIGVSALAAGLVAGFLWQNIGASVTFIYGGVVALVATLLLIVFRGSFCRVGEPTG
ncbi:MAG TPA: MFS transporter [Sedimentisphaerales bacterium]|nr:MFS transporter [Sedimentisphaerales bacterium]